VLVNQLDVVMRHKGMVFWDSLPAFNCMSLLWIHQIDVLCI